MIFSKVFEQADLTNPLGAQGNLTFLSFARAPYRKIILDKIITIVILILNHSGTEYGFRVPCLFPVYSSGGREAVQEDADRRTVFTT